ncbi:MAG: hypothetical protein RJA70_1241 [Pseudomonadota bacterium]|jgi:hypothetical protein
MKRTLRPAVAALWLLGSAAFPSACAQLAGVEEGELAEEFRDDKPAPTSTSDGDPPEPTVCQAYCQAIQENCTGTNKQYSGKEVCELVCEVFPEGKLGATTGNTLGCRATSAANAAKLGEPRANCPVAGPGGEDVCGTKCDAYCDLMGAFCPGAFKSRLECHTQCATVPAVGRAFSAELHVAGDSIECRLYHASQASIDSVVHCGHAAGDFICR